MIGYGDFMPLALRITSLDCFSYIHTRELLHHFFKRRVFLPHNLIELRRFNSGFLQLLIRSARFDWFVLARVTYQQDAVDFLEPMQELIHLLSARKARFVENVEPLLPVEWFFASRQAPLQRARFASTLTELLRRARRWREAFDLVAITICDFPDRA